MATQALLKSLCYDTRGQDRVQQTVAGLAYYDGNPYDFEQWHFVEMGKFDAYASKKDVEVRDQDRIELSVKVIDGLKDDALKCAVDLGRDVVVAPDGVLRIAEAIKASWAGKLEITTKELYREGTDARGSSSTTHRVWTAASTSMSVPSRSGDRNRTKLGAICSEVAQRGSTHHVVVNVVLQDCVDLIWEAAEAGRTSASATLENTITAFVACATASSMTSVLTLQGSHHTIDDEESKATPSAFPARTARAKRQAPMFRNDDEERREKRPVRSLPQPSSTMTRINLKTDPRVFAVLDDGCNCTCHTAAFIDHTRAVLESEGKELSPLVDEAKHYTGIGGCRATGRRSIPFGLALRDGSSVRAVLMSNELSIGTERIMLLNIKAQATLGLVKTREQAHVSRRIMVSMLPCMRW